MFSERLRLLRSETNLTQEEIALKFNVSRQVYANWESKRSEPDITMIVTIANYFGVSIDYLCGVTDIRDRIYEDKEICKYINKCLSIYDEFFADKR